MLLVLVSFGLVVAVGTLRIGFDSKLIAMYTAIYEQVPQLDMCIAI